MNYYNEFDKKAAAWLRELIAQGHIAPGVVDERSIKDVRPNDLKGFTQCHFFAGIGVWSYALRRAGWPDHRRVWTGSCPCQPFSNAGRGDGVADERHLWPHFYQLIAQCNPPTVFGEQVASKDGLGWLDAVHADMEAAGYAFAAGDLCAAGVGAPHIRQRLFFVASSVADTQRPGLQVRADADLRGALGHDEGRLAVESGDGGVRGLADPAAPGQRVVGWGGGAGAGHAGAHPDVDHEAHGPGPTNGHWRNADWVFCRDGKWRPVESGTSPLAHGSPERVGRLRGYGNAIVAQAAEAFIASFLDIEGVIT